MLAKPGDLSDAGSLGQVLDVTTFFDNPANKGKIQFASDETTLPWIKMSRYYRSALVVRDGEVAELSQAVDKEAVPRLLIGGLA